MNEQLKSYEINGEPASSEQFNHVALDPMRSIVVRACAGSGKTWLLTSRIIRLLLDGVPPQHILAITFTKKAAQEMRDRVISVLQELADPRDDVVLKQLIERGISQVEAEKLLPRAKKLYDIVLGSGQEIPIYTFHAWFYRLLQAAPMGSGVMRDASLVEDASELKHEAWNEFFKRLNETDGFELREHYLSLVRELDVSSVEKMFNLALSQVTEFQLFKEECQKKNITFLDALAQDLLEQTGLDVMTDEASSVQSVYQRWANGLNAKGELDVWLKVLSHGDTKKQERSQALLDAFNVEDARCKYEQFLPYLVKEADRINMRSNQMTQQQVKELGDEISKEQYDEAIDTLNSGFSQVLSDLADLRAYRIHIDALPCIEMLIETYQAIKRRTQQLDFNDIERQCLHLLSNENSATYVQVQLDARYKHLLFDEFQDTNPLQWHTIKAWLDAYEEDAAKPHVFVVGDVKQSIYRFRRADVRLFDAAESFLKDKYNADVLKTHATRRNSRAVVAWVNAMFSLEQSELAEPFTMHNTFNNDIGHVACLSLIEEEPIEENTIEENTTEKVEEDSEEAAPPRDWLSQPQQTIDTDVRDDESVQLIDCIQQLVGHYPVKDEDTGEYRPACYADIMLLVHTRTHLSVYERLLREAHIPFVSSRRGGLLDTLEALDLMALVRWLMNADDDLSLLHVLRTPIFGATNEDLEALLDALLSLDSGCSYWQALNSMSKTTDNLNYAKTLLNDWLHIAPHQPPHDVLDRIYAQGEVLKCYAEVTPAWLATQVQANLREFLQLSLSINSGRYPSLSSYYHALKHWQSLDSEGLSEAEPLGMRNAIRVLTVHASKGLEAPIVMLIDMKTKTARVDSNKWFVDWPVHADAPTHLSWVGTKKRIGQWRAEQLDDATRLTRVEKWNQCYVAMTRARQLLVVSAAQVSQTNETDDVDVDYDAQKKTGLYEHLLNVFKQLDSTERLTKKPTEWSDNFDVWSSVMSNKQITANESPVEKKQGNTYTDIKLVDGIVEQQREQFLNININLKENLNNSAAALGSAWHGALQFATDNWGHRLTIVELVQRFNINHEQANLVQTWVKQTLGNTEWQIWFDPTQYDEAVNEMSIMSPNGVLKRIDRWVRHGNKLTIIDYKSYWDADTATALPTYQKQVREYMSLLAALYPETQVRGLLLSADGRLVEV